MHCNSYIPCLMRKETLHCTALHCTSHCTAHRTHHWNSSAPVRCSSVSSRSPRLRHTPRILRSTAALSSGLSGWARTSASHTLWCWGCWS